MQTTSKTMSHRPISKGSVELAYEWIFIIEIWHQGLAIQFNYVILIRCVFFVSFR